MDGRVGGHTDEQTERRKEKVNLLAEFCFSAQPECYLQAATQNCGEMKTQLEKLKTYKSNKGNEPLTLQVEVIIYAVMWIQIDCILIRIRIHKI